MEKEIPGIGRLAPDFIAKTSDNNDIQFQDILNLGKNVVLIFYRGHW